MLSSAASATSTRKPFIATSRMGGIRRTSGTGGGAPTKTCRQTAAEKQKALKITSSVPVATIIQSETTPARRLLAPMPHASAPRPVRTHAA